MNYSHPPRAHLVDCGPASAPLAAANTSHTSLSTPHAYSSIRAKAPQAHGRQRCRRRTRRTCSRPARRRPPAACPRSRGQSPSRSTCSARNASHTSPCMRLCECVCQCCKGAYSRARPHTTACEGARRCIKPRSCVVSPFALLPNALMLLLFVTTTASGSSSCCRPSCTRAPNEPAMQCGGQRAAADWHVTSGTLAGGLTSADKKTPAVKRPLCAASRMHGMIASASGQGRAPEGMT